VFEDQRSGETLGKLQKVRTDVEKLIAASINVLFTSLVGIVFVMIYAWSVHWLIAPIYFLTIPALGFLSSVLSKKIKVIQKTIVAETTALAGATTESLRNIELVKSLGLAPQEIARLNGTTDKILQLELKKVRYIRSLSFIQGTVVNALRTHRYTWPEVLDVTLLESDPWPKIDFSDGLTVGAMGIQGSEKARARRATAELAALIKAKGEAGE